MVKLEYSGLDLHKEGFKGNAYIEGFLIPAADYVIPINTTWNSKVEPVQYIIYDTYTLERTIRDSEYQRFQKIQYAAKITAIQADKNYSLSIIEFTSEKLVNEFWKISLKFKDLDNKNTENVIQKVVSADTKYIDIWDQSISYFTAPIILDVINDVTYEQVLADDFKDRISDYSSIKEFYNLRIFLTSSELSSFYEQLQEVGSFSLYKIKYDNYSYSEFDVQHQLLGENLYQVTIKLFFNNRITLPGIDYDLLEVIVESPDDYIKHE